MKPPLASSRISRRMLLSTAATLPTLSELVVASTAQAQGRAGVLPSVERRAGEAGDHRVRQGDHDERQPEFLPPAARIAEFDQDGTLWVEHPVYMQIVYRLDHVGALVKEKPELKDQEPFKTVLSGDREAIAKLSTRDFFELCLRPRAG